MKGRLKRRASSTGWQQRVRELVLAGGALGVVGCATDGHGSNNAKGFEGGFCGNANPDPCICGRPEASAQGADRCAAKTACDRLGRDYTFERDGQVVCTPATPTTSATATASAPTNSPDETPLSDGGFGLFCGNANPDPCICGRPKLSEAHAKACDEWKLCTDHGGTWQWDVPNRKTVCVGFDPGFDFPWDGSAVGLPNASL